MAKKNINDLRPSDFAKVHPWDSRLQKSESETIARNVMVALKNNGDKWRALTWGEYEQQRSKDGCSYCGGEKYYFLRNGLICANNCKCKGLQMKDKETFGTFDLILALVVLTAIALFLNSWIKPDMGVDHCYPTNWK